MSEEAGVLEGLRDIAGPVLPVMPELTGYYIVVSTVIVVAITGFLLFSYQRRPLVRAKKLYRELKGNWADLQSSDCGDLVISILRLLLGRHNLSETSYADHDIPITKQQWEWLILQSNQLRFSSQPYKSHDVKKILTLINKLI
ncbi:MAG: DUF4381 domain-containing protein [Gammaproteobacteria bacterium]|nr:DUF4381 domain-containing protein [Gammaproteobacteria bacterium]